jgi:hypothetical protein
MSEFEYRCLHPTICSHCKNKEKEFIEMKRKLEKYESVISTLVGEINTKVDKKNKTIIFEEDGYEVKNVNSEIGENYIIMENKKNLDELNKDELKSLEKQTELHDYENINKYVNEGSTVYNIGNTITKAGKFFLGFI